MNIAHGLVAALAAAFTMSCVADDTDEPLDDLEIEDRLQCKGGKLEIEKNECRWNVSPSYADVHGVSAPHQSVLERTDDDGNKYWVCQLERTCRWDAVQNEAACHGGNCSKLRDTTTCGPLWHSERYVRGRRYDERAKAAAACAAFASDDDTFFDDDADALVACEACARDNTCSGFTRGDDEEPDANDTFSVIGHRAEAVCCHKSAESPNTEDNPPETGGDGDGDGDGDPGEPPMP